MRTPPPSASAPGMTYNDSFQDRIASAAKAREKAQKDAEARGQHHGKTHIGGGRYMDQADIEAIAQSRLQPTLDQINDTAEKKRAKDEEMRLDKEEQERQKRTEKQKHKEEKDEQKHIKREFSVFVDSLSSILAY